MLCLGTVYSWSIFRTPLEALLNVGATESLLPFAVVLMFYSGLMTATGFAIDRFGCRRITAIGGIVTGVGYVLSSFATNIPTLIVTYGAIGGAGVGIGYGAVLALIAKWFPDRKGLALGLTLIGFGLSPLITAPLARTLIARYGISFAFTALGIGFAAIVVLISISLKPPPPGWQPPHWQPRTAASAFRHSLDRPIWRCPTFYGLWLCYTIGTFIGLSAIGISGSVAIETIALEPTTAAASVSLFAVFNGLGRPLFGWLTDRFQPRFAAITSFVAMLIASILMLSASQGQILTYLVAFCLFWLCLGGWLAIAPTTTLKLFNPENYARNYGIVFSAYGVGALLGTLVIGQLRDLSGSYTYTFYPTAGLAILGILIATVLLKPNPRGLKIGGA
jgi:MFS family permease